MVPKRPDVTSIDFAELAGVLQEGDELGVLLRGHLWIESLLEYVTRAKLERPEAIDWSRARLASKLELADAVGALDPEWITAIRLFNRLRNKLAHELTFQVRGKDIDEIIGSLAEPHQQRTRQLIDSQLKPLRQIQAAQDQGLEVEFEPGTEWYPRVMTPARAALFAFIASAVRIMAISGALDTYASDTRGSTDAFIRHLDDEVVRLTGGLYRWLQANETNET